MNIKPSATSFREMRALLKPHSREMRKKIIALLRSAKNPAQPNLTFNPKILMDVLALPKTSLIDPFKVILREIKRKKNVITIFDPALIISKNRFEKVFNEIPPIFFEKGLEFNRDNLWRLKNFEREFRTLRGLKNQQKLKDAHAAGRVKPIDVDDLVKNAQVVFFGENHTEPSHAETLLDCLPHLRRAGICALALEGLLNDSHTRASLARYYVDPDPQHIRTITKRIQQGSIWGETAARNLIALIEKATALGMRIVPLEDPEGLARATKFFIEGNIPGLQAERRQGNDAWADAMERALARGDKVAVFCGAHHVCHDPKENPMNSVLASRLGRPLGPVVHFRSVEGQIDKILLGLNTKTVQSQDLDGRADFIWWTSNRPEKSQGLKSIFLNRSLALSAN